MRSSGCVEPVRAVEDLGVGVALDAEQAAVDRARGSPLHRDDAPVLGGDLDAAADAAEAADALVPVPAGHRVERAGGIREAEAGQSDGRRGGRGDAGAQELAAGERVFHGLGSRKTIPVSAEASVVAVDEVVDELDAADMGEMADLVEETLALAAVGALEDGDTAPGRRVEMVDGDARRGVEGLPHLGEAGRLDRDQHAGVVPDRASAATRATAVRTQFLPAGLRPRK